MPRIVPAILTDDPQALERMIRQAETFTDYVQIDVMDGKFVPSQSINCEDIARIPTKLAWEAHLMVVQPEDYFDGFKKAGARRIIFHYEAARSPEAVIARANSLGLQVGIALNPDTSPSAVLPLLKTVDSVLLLSVIPGFYGSKFIPDVLDKVEQLHLYSIQLEIGIDGGIKENNIVQVARSGVDSICVGSAIFSQPDPKESYHRLLNLIQETA